MPYSFDPIINSNSKILILGSFPSIKSVENDFYYGNPRNHFWSIISEIFQQKACTNTEKKQLILKNGIALWDTVYHCERQNSADSKLKVIEVNDIEGLLDKFPRVRTIAFNGKKSFSEYQKHFRHLSVSTKVLPSTSPANAAISYQKKLEAYRLCLL